MSDDVSTTKQKSLKHERLLEQLQYDPDIGCWTWKSGVRQGLAAGTLDKAGYRVLGLDHKKYRSARLAWFYMTATWPKGQVDHRDMNRRNDRWSNLRLATHAQNNQNKPRKSNNTSGAKGVTWHKRRGKWQAQISVDGRLIYLGLRERKEDAQALYSAAASRFHLDFARIG